MADNVAITAGSGTNIATDDVSGIHIQKVKLVDGTADASTAIPAGGGTEASALRVTIATDSSGVVSVDDNGATLSVDDGAGSLTVDGTVATTQSGTWTEANSAAIKTAAELLDDTVATDGAAAPTKGVMLAGTDGTNAQTVKTDTGGELQVDVLSIATGDNNIGNVDLASAIPAGTNNIGDVDIASLPNEGQQTMANSISVAVASDQGNVPTKEVRSASPTQSSVAGSATSVSLLASSATRLGATIYNDSSAALYLKLGSTASTTSFTVKLLQDDYYEVPFGYTGAIDGIWASATGNARITVLES